MPLQFQHFPVRILGLDQKIDEKNAVPGQLTVAENLVMSKTAKISKRLGFTEQTLPPGKTIGYDGIASFDGGIEGASAGWKASFYQVGEWSSNTLYDAADFAQTDTVAQGVIEGRATGNGVRVTNHDPVSRKQFSESLIGSAQCYFARALKVGSNLWQFYTVNQALYVRVTDGATVNTYQIGVGAEVLATNKFVDAEVLDDESAVAVMYNAVTGGVVVQIAAVGAPSVWNKYTIIGGATLSHHNVSTSGTKAGTQLFYLSYRTGGTTYSRTISAAGTLSTQVTVSTAVAGGDMVLQAGEYVMHWDLTGPVVGVPTAWGTNIYKVDYGAGSVSTVGKFPALMPLGRSWRDATYRYWIVQTQGLASDVTNQVAGLLRQNLSTNAFELLGTFWDGYVKTVNEAGTNNLPSCMVFNQRRIYGATGDYPVRVQQTLAKFEGAYAFTLVEFESRTTVQYAELRDQLFFIKNLNPIRTLGKQFPTSASFPAMGLVSSPTGSLTPSAAYSYVVTWVYYDDKGNEWESAPSIPATITIGAGDGRVAMSIWAYPFMEDSELNVYSYRLYRTVGNGELHYLVYEVFQSDAAFNITDTTADSVILGNRVLYTESGEIENRGGPASDYVLSARGRLWAISSEDGSLWVTKERGNNLGSSFSLSLVNDIYANQRPVALAELDEKTLVFTPNEVFVVFGNGPDNLGSGAFSIQRLPHTVGCRDPQSVVTTEYGVFFMSEKGIYVIDRGLNLQYIGAQVEDYNSQTILASIAIDEREEIWFAFATGVLVYDTFHRIWFVHTGLAIKDLVMHQNKPTISTGSEIWQETAATYQDDGVSYNQVLTTGWLALAQIVGFQRIKLITIPVSGRKGMVVSLWYDNDDSGAAAETFTLADAATNYHEMEIKPGQQKCDAIKIKIVHSSATSGLNLHGITMEVGIKGGGNRLPDANRVEGT